MESLLVDPMAVAVQRERNHERARALHAQETAVADFLEVELRRPPADELVIAPRLLPPPLSIWQRLVNLVRCRRPPQLDSCAI